MHIGQISELSGYSQRMIRYLEDQGLIEPDRSDSNLRKFRDGDLTRILKIKKLKELGFTYAEIKELIDQNENALVERGAELLKRHHAEARDLLEKMRQLETICYGQVKTKSIPAQMMALSHPQRTAYRIKKLDAVCEILGCEFPELKSETTFWKFGEFFKTLDKPDSDLIEVVELFRGASQLVVLSGLQWLTNYESAWSQVSIPLGVEARGPFQLNEFGEFFGHYEIVIEHKITKADGTTMFHVLLPYQAIYIASGEAKP